MSRREPCRIYEYDGAFRCYAHKRTWGAVTDPDQPCRGAPTTSKSGGGWRARGDDLVPRESSAALSDQEDGKK